MATHSASQGRTEAGLRAEAQAWEPRQAAHEQPPRPIRTQRRSGGHDVLAVLDAVPFTPSQGVCTPSPTNMAAMWVQHPHFFTQPAWGPMGGAYAGSPGPSSGASDASMMHASSQPGTPGGVMWSSFCQPLPYSPTALQIAAASGALGSDPSTPVRGRPGSAGAGGAPFLAAMPGSPMMPISPGQMMFAQYFGADGSSKLSHSPPESHHSSGSGDEGDGSDNVSSSGSGGGLEVSEAAHQIASAMCAAQQLPGEPPQQLLELASLLHAYGLVSAVPSFPHNPHAAPAPLSPDSRRQAARQRQKSAPKLNPDGSVRLNARQRRTLRRAQERAMKALLEAQSRAHGISSEQAAAHLASMGVASMLLGSPTPAPAPMMVHGSPVQAAFMPAAPPAMLASPGPMLAQPDYGMLHSMQQAAAASAMMQQAGAGGFDGGWGVAPGADMPLPYPMAPAAYSTPPRAFPPGRVGGYAGPRHGSGGFRSGGSGRTLSRFAPSLQDAVAAF